MKISIGPGALVAAAFIGPGTVTTCTLAGAQHGFSLLWALVFATVATILFQEMAARLGVGGDLGLGEALVQIFEVPWRRIVISLLVFFAIVIGNAAYEAGNLSGGAMGLRLVLPASEDGGDGLDQTWLVVLLSLLAGIVLFVGSYKFVERFLISLVLVMGLAFVFSAIMIRPHIGDAINGLVPRIPKGGWLTAVALIGTTVVPYNLFLHASAAKRKWQTQGQDKDIALRQARLDTIFSVGVGGIISMMILAVATCLTEVDGEVKNAAAMAKAIEPVFGTTAKYMVGLGLCAAGLSSAVTAPLATGYVLAEILPIKTDRTRKRIFRGTALTILAIGTIVSCLGIKTVSLIVVAQVANGLLLPIIAGFLLYVMNQRSLLGRFVNRAVSNGLGILIVLLTFGLGMRTLLRAFGMWPS